MRLDIVRIREIEAIKNFEERVLAAAVMYAEAGFYVIPIRPNQKAIPPKSHGLNYVHASRNIDTVRAWFEPDSKYCGWNIGLACGASDGIFVVDVDAHGDINGFDTLRDIEEDFGELETLVQTTPNGGKHFVYQWFHNGASSTSKIGRGVDTRGGDGKCRSHIVAWPSVVDGREYKWERYGDVEEAPEFFSELLGEPWSSGNSKESGRGSENVGDEDTERQYMPREIWQMLTKIDPDDLNYDQWLQVGQAIHSQHPDEKGIKLWDSWSKRGERYEAGECKKRWAGFRAYGPVRIGTLIFIAKRHGYVPKPQIEAETKIETDSEYDKLIDELNKEYGVAVVGGKIRIVSQSINKDPEQDITLLTMDDFKAMTMNKKTVISGANGQSKAVPKTMIWLGDERRKEFTGGIQFRPDKETEFYGPNGLTYNLWTGFALKPKKGDWSKLRRHIEEVICSGNEEHYTWLLDWMADLYQEPADPKGCAVVLKGKEGSGKGILFEAIGRTLGRHYKHLTEESHLTGRFNGHHQDTLLLFADELVYGGDKKHSGKLKALVTEKKLMVERKGLDAFSYRNYARVGIASNEDWFIPAGPESRRWFVIETDNSRTKDHKWFMDILEEMENGGVEAMMYDLMRREVTSNLKRAPETELLQDQRNRFASSKNDSLQEWWEDVLERGTVGVQCLESDEMNVSWPRLVDRMDLYDQYILWCTNRSVHPLRIVNKQLFYTQMQKFGAPQVRPGGADVIKRMGGTRKRVFQFEPLEKMIETFEQQTGKKLD